MAFNMQRLRTRLTGVTAAILKSSHVASYTSRRKAQKFPFQTVRSYASGSGSGDNKQARRYFRASYGVYAAIAAAGIGGGYYLWTTQGGSLNVENAEAEPEFKYCPKYQSVYNAIAELLEDETYDDGSYGPIFARLAWHSSGTYDKKDKTGGSCKATMRFEPESEHDANAGLHIARQRLEKVKKQFPWISYGDLWTLAGVCAVQEMGGPIIKWRNGRKDGTAADCPPDGRLPDGSKETPAHPREVFYRMGFEDAEIVALVGAHTLGRCHCDRSGFEGQWVDSPTTFSNAFFVELLGRTWVPRKWSGPKQFQDKETETLMMLPTDMSFLQDCRFKKLVQLYANNEQKYFEDFAKAYQKLLELGVPIPKGKVPFVFKTTNDQGVPSPPAEAPQPKC